MHSACTSDIPYSSHVFIHLTVHQKNKPGRIIVVYDEDEVIASTVATKFVERDVENVFMLSGGEHDKGEWQQ